MGLLVQFLSVFLFFVGLPCVFKLYFELEENRAGLERMKQKIEDPIEATNMIQNCGNGTNMEPRKEFGTPSGGVRRVPGWGPEGPSRVFAATCGQKAFQNPLGVA